MPDWDIQEANAQRWHDEAGHKNRYDALFSSCFCCCTLCDPDYEPTTPNPYWPRRPEETQ